MPVKMKCYTTDYRPLVSEAVKPLLEQEPHVRWGTVYIVAASKREAVELLNASRAACGQYTPRNLALAGGGDIDCLTDAQLCQEPAVYVLPLHHPGPVVKAMPGSDPVVIGRTQRAPIGDLAFRRVFIRA